MDKKILVIDLDNVLRDISTTMCGIYNEELNKTGNEMLTPEMIDEYDLSITMAELGNLHKCDVHDYLFIKRANEVFSESAMVDRRQNYFLNLLREKYRIVIATSQHTDYCKRLALDWLMIYGVPYDDIIFTNDKSWIECDIMVDDYQVNLYNSKAKKKYLFLQPYNIQYKNEFETISSLGELINL